MKNIYLLLSVVLLSSCSNLRVQVSTANPESLKKIAAKIDPLEKEAFHYRKILNPLYSTQIIVDKDLIMEQFNENLRNELNVGKVDQLSFYKSEADFKTNYSDIVYDLHLKYSIANDFILKKEYQKAINIYLSIEQLFQKLKSNLEDEMILKENQKSSIILEISRKLSAVNAVFYNGRANLLGDQIVSYITMKENDSIWKSTYNRTASRTYFGNADIAIILNEMPNNYNNNYSIKGVRVDAAKLIQSTFDVMTQVVNVAASMSGILPANAGDTNSFYPEEFEEIKTLSDKTSELQNKTELLKETQKQLLLKILGEGIQNKKDDDLKKSVSDIKDFWDEYKLNLD